MWVSDTVSSPLPHCVSRSAAHPSHQTLTTRGTLAARPRSSGLPTPSSCCRCSTCWSRTATAPCSTWAAAPPGYSTLIFLILCVRHAFLSPALDAPCGMLGAHAYPIRIGACTPTAWPICVFRCSMRCEARATLVGSSGSITAPTRSLRVKGRRKGEGGEGGRSARAARRR